MKKKSVPAISLCDVSAVKIVSLIKTELQYKEHTTNPKFSVKYAAYLCLVAT